jgi:hypothetical protein
MGVHVVKYEGRGAQRLKRRLGSNCVIFGTGCVWPTPTPLVWILHSFIAIPYRYRAESRMR